ncbi:hypothetical protein GCM10020331_048180 [Ectobacillus funiculus]
MKQLLLPFFAREDRLFLTIEELIEKAMHHHSVISHPNLDEIREIDWATRRYVMEQI